MLLAWVHQSSILNFDSSWLILLRMRQVGSAEEKFEAESSKGERRGVISVVDHFANHTFFRFRLYIFFRSRFAGA